jgi:molecular chaperone DnaK (HSP70)
MADEHYYIGIDLGTTNSSMHWGAINAATRRIEPRPLPFDQPGNSGSIERRLLVPSYLWFRQGEPAPVVGEYARNQGLMAQPSRVARAVKNYMGRHDWAFEVDTQRYTAAQLSATILKTMYAGIIKTWGKQVDDVVITVPASFDGDMRADTLEAARLAGFKTAEKDGGMRNFLLDEPRAALYDLLNQQLAGYLPPGLLDLSSPKTVLVFDLGGGTLDVSLHRIQQATDVAETLVDDLAISRYTQLGGGVFDQLIADELQLRFEERAKINVNSLSPDERNQLRVKLEVQAEQVKQRLTDDIEARLSQGIAYVPDDFAVDIQIPFLFDNKGLFTRLTKKEFEQIISPLLGATLTLDSVDHFDRVDYTADNIITPILDVLHKAWQGNGHTPQVDAVILNGGMTRVHAIRERLQTLFGLRPITVLDPEHAVSRGAAVYHYLLHRGWRPKQILAESIGVEVDDGQIYPLVPAGTVLPFRKALPNRFAVPNDGARSIHIPLYRGEGKTPAPPNKKILERRFVFRQPQAKGTAINVEISIDDNKLVHFVATLPHGEKAEVRVGAEDTAAAAPPVPGASPKPTPPPEPVGPAQNPASFRQEFRQAASQWDEPKLKQLGLTALNARNSEALIGVLLENAATVQRPGRQRIMWVLGEYGRRHPNDPRLSKIVDACLRSIHDNMSHPQALNTVARNAIVALGKIGSGIAESHLINLLDDPRSESIRGDILTALGKCGQTVNAVQHIQPYLNSARESERINALWALGKLGSREHQPVLPISALAELIPEIGQHTDPAKERHLIARKNAVYALGEIGDRRSVLGHGDVVDEAYADYVIKVMSRVLKQLSAAGTPQAGETQHIRRLAEIAAKQVKGETLTEDETRTLMSVRTLMAVSEDE